MHTIRVHISGEDEIFNPFDANRDMLNDGFIAFMKRQYDLHPRGDLPVIQILSDAPVDEGRVRAAIEGYIAGALERNRAQRRRNRLVELYLFLLGVACITAGILLSRAGTLYLQILSLTAGFAIKEAATIFFMKNPKNTIERAKLLYISQSSLEFGAWR